MLLLNYFNKTTRYYNVRCYEIILLPCAHMCSRVMCLVMSVCVPWCMVSSPDHTLYTSSVWGRDYVCMCVCIYVEKKQAVWGLSAGKSPVSVIYCSLIKFNGQKGGLLCQVSHSGKEIWNHSINGMEKGSWEIVLRCQSHQWLLGMSDSPSHWRLGVSDSL